MSLTNRLTRLEQTFPPAAGGGWEGHPDADLLTLYPWLAWLSDDELARLAGGGSADEFEAAGEARRAAGKPGEGYRDGDA